jgi:hypothetical protein
MLLIFGISILQSPRNERTHQNFSLQFKVNLLESKLRLRRTQPLSLSILVLIRADLLQIEGWNFGGEFLGPKIINFSLGV